MSTFVSAPPVRVFNADFSPLDAVHWQDAVGMMLREVALVLEPHDPPRVLRSPSTVIEVPKSMLLVRYAAVPYRRTADHAGRSEILRRDDHACQYAGCDARATTIDHVFPRSRGGGNTWTNLVACCAECNHRKADHTPAEAGMRLVREPFRPAAV